VTGTKLSIGEHRMRFTVRNIAFALLFGGAAFAIGAYNPFFGQPNLHPAPWVVISGAVVATIGAYLLGFRVEPRKPRVRTAAIVIMITMALLALASLFL